MGVSCRDYIRGTGGELGGDGCVSDMFNLSVGIGTDRSELAEWALPDRLRVARFDLSALGSIACHRVGFAPYWQAILCRTSIRAGHLCYLLARKNPEIENRYQSRAGAKDIISSNVVHGKNGCHSLRSLPPDADIIGRRVEVENWEKSEEAGEERNVVSWWEEEEKEGEVREDNGEVEEDTLSIGL